MDSIYILVLVEGGLMGNSNRDTLGSFGAGEFRQKSHPLLGCRSLLFLFYNSSCPSSRHIRLIFSSLLPESAQPPMRDCSKSTTASGSMG